MDSLPSRPGKNLFLAIAAVLGFSLAAAYLFWHREVAREPLSIRSTARNKEFAKRGATEENWMAAQIGRHITESIAFASTRDLPEKIGTNFSATRIREDERYRFVGRLPSRPEARIELGLSEYFWSPSNFVGWANELLLRWAVSASPASQPDTGIFERLLTPRPDVLIREDQRLSQALTKAPLDPQLHEEAALLVGSFILREAAASFCDTRRELCAISSHLALARAIRATPSDAGELAEALLCVLGGRESDATVILDRIRRNADRPDGPGLANAQAWECALTMRNTGDYRLLDDSSSHSLLERLEYFRALRASISTAAADAYLLKSSPERLAEWPVVILAGPITVADGNRWAEEAFAGNLAEAAAEYQHYFGRRISENDWTALNAVPEYFALNSEHQPSYQVLGWGSWAGFRQRQLCSLAATTFYWLDELLDLNQDAVDFRSRVVARFSGLTLFPLVRLYDSVKERNLERSYCEGVQKLFREHPELVSFELSHRATDEARGWFKPLLPFGTTFDLGYRNDWYSLDRLSLSDLERVKALAPHNIAVLDQHLKAISGGRPTPAQVRKEFASLTYHWGALWRMANASKDEPEIYKDVFGKLCELDPDYFTNLGNYLVEHKEPKAAAIAYQKAIDRAPDRIRVSNTCRWLANYYYDHGRRDDAIAIAQMAADVYSSSGLETAAYIMERDGRLIEAEKFLKQCKERYEQPAGLIAFYARHQSENPSFASEYRKQLSTVFPRGMQKVEKSALAGAPETGVRLRTVSEKSAAMGLKLGDVIVAINGTQITNLAQYFVAIDSAADSHISFIAWDGRAYITAAADLPDHRLGVTLENVGGRK